MQLKIKAYTKQIMHFQNILFDNCFLNYIPAMSKLWNFPCINNPSFQKFIVASKNVFGHISIKSRWIAYVRSLLDCSHWWLQLLVRPRSMKITYENSPYHYILINHLAQLYHIPLFPLWDTILLSCYCGGCVEFWSKFNDPPPPTPPVFHVHILIRILIQTQKRVPWASSFLGAYPHLDVVMGPLVLAHCIWSKSTVTAVPSTQCQTQTLWPSHVSATHSRTLRLPCV